MTDIAAALGLVQLERAEELLAARRSLAAAYTQDSAASHAVDLLELPEDAPTVRTPGTCTSFASRWTGSGSIEPR